MLMERYSKTKSRQHFIITARDGRFINSAHVGFERWLWKDIHFLHKFWRCSTLIYFYYVVIRCCKLLWWKKMTYQNVCRKKKFSNHSSNNYYNLIFHMLKNVPDTNHFASSSSAPKRRWQCFAEHEIKIADRGFLAAVPGVIWVILWQFLSFSLSVVNFKSQIGDNSRNSLSKTQRFTCGISHCISFSERNLYA